MKINEVEELLSITRASIRFYEKEGLLSPIRSENNYRDYSEENVQQLKKILILRKLGFTIEEIQNMQNGNVQLNEVIDDNITRLESEITKLQGSLKIAQQLKTENIDYNSLNENHYWNLINEEEKSGKKFAEICNDYLKWELNLFDLMWKYTFFHDFKKSRKKYGVIIASVLLLLICIIRGFSNKFLWQGSFLEGFIYPIIIFAIGSAIMLPIYILMKKCPKTAAKLVSVMMIVIIAFFALLALSAIVLIVNSIFHFW